MHKRLGYADPLLVALGEVPDVLAQHAAQADHLNDPVDRRPGLGSRHLPDPGDKLEVLNNLHVDIKRRALRQVANRLPHLHGVLKSLYVIHIDAAGICYHVGCYNLQGRRLPGSIGPKEAENLTRPDLKADVVYGDCRSVGFSNVLYLNHELISTAPLCLEEPRLLLRWFFKVGYLNKTHRKIRVPCLKKTYLRPKINHPSIFSAMS